VTLSAVDEGVLNITDYPVPDAWSALFAKRAYGTEAFDLYGRLIEALEGGEGKLRYGGDLSGDALPAAQRPNPRINIVDLASGLVAFDAHGQAVLKLAVPDFNGSLRLAALAFDAEDYGNAEAHVSVRAPLIVEPSMPRVMAAGDRAVLSIDLRNDSGRDGTARIGVKAGGPLQLGRDGASVALKAGAKATLQMPLTAGAGTGVAGIDIHAELGDFAIDRHFEFTVRPAWPATHRSVPIALEPGTSQRLDGSAGRGLLASTLAARLTLSRLPPLPYAAALAGALDYPYGCIEQTTSKGWAALILDPATAGALGTRVLDEDQRRARIEGALARQAAFQVANGHFSFWGGHTGVTPFMTPYVVDFMLDARENGYQVPDNVLQKALARLNEDLLGGGQRYYSYEHHEHLRIANQAYAGFVLARVNRAPLGTLRTIFDNERQKLVGPLPLAHFAVALKLAGDNARAAQAMAEAFAWDKPRPWYVGDYGSELRDLALMAALAHRWGLARPAYDAKLIAWARDADANLRRRQAADPDYRWSWSHLSTQEQIAIGRIAHAFDAAAGGALEARVTLGDTALPAPDGGIWSRRLDAAELARGVSLAATGTTPVFATLDIAGVGATAPAADASQIAIQRRWYTTDGKPWQGTTLKEGEMLIAALEIEARQPIPDALVTDLLPGGLEAENLNLSGAGTWAGVVVDGINLEDHLRSADSRHEEYRDDRYVAALALARGRKARLFYLVRAVTPGSYGVPPPFVEDQYRPALRGIGSAEPATLRVVEP